MNHHPRHAKLARLSAQLEELLSRVSDCGGVGAIPQDLADEIAATAGEVMVELSDQRGDELVRGVIEEARRLREVARALSPTAAEVSAAAQSLVSALGLVIRTDKRAA